LEDFENKVSQSGFFKNGVLDGKGCYEDRKLNITQRGVFQNGVLHGLGMYEDKHYKAWSFNKGKLTASDYLGQQRLLNAARLKWSLAWKRLFEDKT